MLDKDSITDGFTVISKFSEPLASRMMPQNLDEFIGQEHILSKGKLLRRMIEANRISSIILYGPPGTGKTSIAKIIANQTHLKFEKLNAVTSGVSDIKRIVVDNSSYIYNSDGKTLLFVDEIHRFNKAQQDALLPHVENGSLVLIGATTENPYFEVNKALISRSTVFQLYPLQSSDISKIVAYALMNKERGLGNYNINIDSSVIDLLSEISSGDARIALNAIELAVMTTQPDSNSCITISRDIIMECLQNKSIKYDKDGENHYDTISALIKSMRDSDPDASVHYLARALIGGEDIEFLARRIIICASEDVGMANPSALNTAVSALNAIKNIGMPEASIILSQAVLTIACSPKSNSSYIAINKAMSDVKSHDVGIIPFHLRNSPIPDMKNLGYSNGYNYPHSFPDNYVDEDYLPEVLKGKSYYTPSKNGYEDKINLWYNKYRLKFRQTD